MIRFEGDRMIRTSTELVRVPASDVEVRGSHDLEVRDPSAATKPLQWTQPGLAQVQEWNADKAFRLGYAANVIAYRCVQLRANAIASVPLLVGRNGRHNENAPLARLLSPPELGGRGAANKLSARKLIRWTVGQEIVTGRRAWEIETVDNSEDGRPVAFWPLASSSLREVPSQGGNEWFRLFEYGRAQDPRKLPPGRVFYGWDPDGRDFRKAESAIGAARYDLSLITLSDRYGIAFLQNNAVPATVVTTEAFPDEVTRRSFRTQWAHEFEGVDNAGRTHFHEVDDTGDGPVGESIDVKTLGLSAKDARLVEARREAMIELAIALGTPWSKLDASGRTFDNADIEDRDWWENTILPDMIDLQDDINTQLAPRLGSDVCWFDLSQVRALRPRINPVTASVGAPTMVFAQLMQINEARADYGLEPIPGGDRMMTVEEINALRGGDLSPNELGAAPAPGSTPPEQDPEDEEDTEEDEDQDAEHARRAEDRAPDPEVVEARRARIWRATDAVATTLESRWERSWRRLFRRQLEATIARLTGKRGRQALGYSTDGTPDGTRAEAEPVDAASIFDVAFWTAASAEISLDLYEQVYAAAFERIALTFEVSFDLEAPWVAETIQTRANQLAGQVTSTTYDAIVDQLVDGVSGGESIDDLAARVRHVFSVANDARATTIARTEVISAYNGAAVGVVERDMPRDVVIAQEWIATRDGRTRDSHASADGQVQLVGQPFTVGGHTAAYPGDPALPASQTVNCRCAVAFLTPQEFEALDRSPRRIETRQARALLALVPFGDDFDELGFRRALEGVAA